MGGPQAATAPVAEPAHAGGAAGPRAAAATSDGRAVSLRLPSGEQARAPRVRGEQTGLCCVAAVARGASVLALRGRRRAVMRRMRRQPRAPRHDPLHAGRVWWPPGAQRSCASCLRGSGRASMGGRGAAAGPPARAPQPQTLAGAGIVARCPTQALQRASAGAVGHAGVHTWPPDCAAERGPPVHGVQVRQGGAGSGAATAHCFMPAALWGRVRCGDRPAQATVLRAAAASGCGTLKWRPHPQAPFPLRAFR